MDLMQSTLEEQEFWLSCVRNMPRLEGYSGTGRDKFGQLIPWGTGPHSVNAFRETFEIIKPKSVFEIGFNNGYASAVFLELAQDAYVFSCDVSLKDETINGAKILEEKYPNRFKYENRNDATFSPTLASHEYDLCFIDGGHLREDVTKDISLCLALDIPYFLFDDVLKQFGDVQEVIDTFSELELVQEFGNIALYKNKNIL